MTIKPDKRINYEFHMRLIFFMHFLYVRKRIVCEMRLRMLDTRQIRTMDIYKCSIFIVQKSSSDIFFFIRLFLYNSIHIFLDK